MASPIQLSTTYGPDSVTTTTPVSGAGGPLGGAPDMSFFTTLMQRKLAAQEAREREAARLRAAQEARERQKHQLAIQVAKDARRAAQDARRPDRGSPVPDKWIAAYDGSGLLTRSINPEYERWAAERGQFDVGPDTAQVIPSGFSTGAAAQAKEREAMARQASVPQGDGDERADFFGTGTTNRKDQAKTLLENARKREEESAADDYLAEFGGGGYGG